MGVFSKLLGRTLAEVGEVAPAVSPEDEGREFTDIESRKPTVSTDAHALLLSQVDKEWEQMKRSVQNLQDVMQSIGKVVQELEGRIAKIEKKS
jgi:hypothetical protein